MPELGRVMTAMVTPFDSDGNIDERNVAELAKALVAAGSDGLVVTGTTGESPTLANDEKLRLYQIVREAVGPNVPLVAGTTTYNTAESVELTREAAKLGVDGFLLTVPAYNKPSAEGIELHFRAIANATDLPCMLYNVPGRTGTNMTTETVVRLREVRNIVGIKEASGNLEQIGAIIEQCGPDFRVWSGNDPDTLPILAIGGYGVVSVTSHVVGLQIQAMVRAFFAGHLAEAAAIHRRHLPLCKALFLVGNPVPVKYALNHLGVAVGPTRLPLAPPDEKTAKAIRDALAAQTIDIKAAALA